MKTRKRKLVALAALALVVATGCGKSSENAAPAGSAGSTTNEAKALAVGLEAAGNDAAVVDLVRKALGCKWGAFGFDSSCAEMKAFVESEAIRDGKGDATLVSMLEDKDEHVRWLGARGLSQRGRVFRSDKQLAERIVKVAEGEKAKAVAQELGGAVGGIKHEDTGLGERIKAMAKGHEVQQMRTSLLSRMLFSNGEALYEFVKDIAKNDKDSVVRKAALSAFYTGTPAAKAGETCAMWLGFVDDAADDVAGEAAYLAAFYPQNGGCKSEWDSLLDKIEKRAKEGTLKSTQMAGALQYLYRQPGTSEAQKKRALAVARVLVENKANSGMARGRSLDFVVEKDPDGKKILEGLKADEDVFVKSRAKDLSEKVAKAEAEKGDKGAVDKPAAQKNPAEKNKAPSEKKP